MNERKIWRFEADGPFIEVGPAHVKLAFDNKTFISINSGGITTQGNINHQSEPDDTTYFGLFSPQSVLPGSFLAGMMSPPTYVLNPALFEAIPDIIGLARAFSGISGI